MKSILYIGNNQRLIADLEASENVEFLHVRNVVGFHNLISKVPDLDLVVSDNQLKGLKADGIFNRYKDILNSYRIPFTVLDNDRRMANRLSFLNLGVMEMYGHDVLAGTIIDRSEFLKDMLTARLEEVKEHRYTEYKIPPSKRVFDIVVAGTAIVLLSPVLIIAALAIKLESKGPVLYISKRVGTGYKVFDFYKLRSMYTDADKRLKEFEHLNQYVSSKADEKEEEVIREIDEHGSPTLIYKDGTPMSEDDYLDLKKKQQAGTFVKIKDDPRVTKVGKFVRNTSIDELPQLFNVIKGDMSVVGNRPLPLYEAEQLTSDDWGERFLAPAGITGLWQVEKRGKGEMSEEERKSLDNVYAKNFSFWNDIKLILRTIPALFQKENV